jgi:hypothetical protein
MTIKDKPVEHWLQWLDDQIQGRGEPNLKPDEIYVLEAFREALTKSTYASCPDCGATLQIKPSGLLFVRHQS